jgi:DegV family protein with EDD domain
VVVDSSSCLPAELVREWNITVAPHELIIDGHPFRDGVDIHPQEFYQRLKENHIAPTTAAPRPQQFLQSYIEASRTAPNVLCLTLSANFSATYEFARAAVPLAKDTLPDVRLEVVDTRAAAGASGLIALAAARCAAAGQHLEQVIDHVNELVPKINLIAFLDTLYYLSRSGKVGKVQAWASTLLGIKPLTELKMGEARMLERPRSRIKAIDRLVAIMRQRVGNSPVYVNIMEADSPAEAAGLLRRIDAEFDCRARFISQFTPVMGAHTGPGVLGLAFYVDKDAGEAARL